MKHQRRRVMLPPVSEQHMVRIMPTLRQQEQTPSEIMRKRWQKIITQQIPTVDQVDVF